MTITGTPGTPGSADTHAKIMMDALAATLQGRASKSQTHQMIGGTQVQHIPIWDLERLYKQYKAEYRREQIAAGNITSHKKIKTRFVI